MMARAYKCWAMTRHAFQISGDLRKAFFTWDETGAWHRVSSAVDRSIRGGLEPRRVVLVVPERGIAMGWWTLRRLAVKTTCLAIVGTIALVAQTPFTIPMGPGGKLNPPPGIKLESVGVIDTSAGSGWQGYGGDGGPAIQAGFRFPRSVAADAAGNIYVSDTRDHRVRKINATGIVTTLAGTGDEGFDGDGGPAAEARLAYPADVAADAAGNIYIADGENHRIRKIATSGIITTVAGTGERGFGGDGGPGTGAQLSYPAGIATDRSGNLYIADSWNHRIRKIDTAGTITTLAGTGYSGYLGDGGSASQSRLAYPADVAVDAAGNVYVADSWNHRVRKVDATGSISTVAGRGWPDDQGDDGPAVEARLAYPVSVTADAADNVYVIAYAFETANHRVRRIDASSGVITAFAGTGAEGYAGDGGPAAEARLAYPTGVASDTAGNIYVADARNARVRVVRTGLQATIPLGQSGDTLALVVDTEAGGVLTYDGKPVVPGRRVEAPNGNTYALLAGENGGVVGEYIPERQQLRIGSGTVTLTRQEDRTWRIGNEAIENGHRYSIGGREYVLELSDGRWVLPDYVIDTVAGGNTKVKEGVNAARASLERPWGVAVDAAGNVYVAEAARPRIRKVDGSGVIATFAGTGEWGSNGDGGPATEAQLNWPRALALDAEGSLFVADELNHRIRRIDRRGIITTFAGTGDCCYSGDGGKAINAQIRDPEGIAVDAMGNIYVANGLDRVRRIDASGIITTFAGTGERGFSGDGGPATEAQLNRPIAVATDKVGNVYVADRENHRVRMIDPNGTITTVAGTGAEGFGGDGGTATQAQLNRPMAVATDGLGSVLVADEGNYRVRKIDPSGVITTFAGNGRCCREGDGGPATRARLQAEGIAVDGKGNVYISDGWRRIRRVDSSGVITTFAGNGEPDFSESSGKALDVVLENPHGVAALPSGDMLFADRFQVWKLDSSGAMSVFAGSGQYGYTGDGGSAVQARMKWIRGLTADSSGNVYVADSYNYRVRKIDTAGEISTLAGTGDEGFSGDGGPATKARLGRICEIAADPLGNVYIAEPSGYRIRKIDTSGRISTIAGTGERSTSGDGGPASLATLRDPCRGIAADHEGNVYVSSGRRIRRIDASSGVINVFKNLDGWDIWSEALAIDVSGNLFVGARHRILKVNTRGEASLIAGRRDEGYGGDGGPARTAGLALRHMAVDKAGDIWIADDRSRRIRVLRRQLN